MSRLTELLARYARNGLRASPALIFDLIRQERFTGPIVFHFRDGKALKIEHGRPVQVDLDPEGSAPQASPS